MSRPVKARRSRHRALSAAVATVLPLALAAPALAHGSHSHGTKEARQVGAHEHGVSTLNIAFDGNVMMMELEAPGADIVGFEYEAETDEDKAKIIAAVAVLEDPAALFVLPAAAGCTLASAEAHLAGEHDDHGHSHGHAHGDETHSAFHAEYSFTCADPAAVTSIGFGYFDAFPNAEEVEVQIVGPNGAQAFEVKRAAPTLALDGLM
jgi:hypothetical protein